MVNLVNQPLVDQLLKQVPSSAIEAASAQLDAVERVADGDLVIIALTKREADLIADRFQEDGFKEGDDELEVALDKICNARAEYDDAPEFGPPVEPITLMMDEQEKRFLAALLVARADIDGPGSTAAHLCDRLVGKELT